MADIPDIDVVTSSDLPTHNVGDTTQFVDNMSEWETRIEGLGGDVNQLSQQAKDMRAALLAAINVLEASDAQKSDLITALTAASQSGDDQVLVEVMTDLLDIRNQSQLNLFPNNGQLIAASSEISGFNFEPDGEIDTETLSAFFENYNGSNFDQATKIGFFAYNSTTYGGTAPANSGAATAFANVMRVGAQARWSPSYGIAEVTAGNGIAGTEYEGHYPFFIMPTASRAGGNIGQTSVSFWYQPVGVDAFIVGAPDTWTRQTFVNGVRLGDTDGDQGSSTHRLAVGGIYHIASHINQPDVPAQPFPLLLLSAPGAKHRIALPRIAAGAFQLLPHTGPVRSVNSGLPSEIEALSAQSINDAIDAKIADLNAAYIDGTTTVPLETGTTADIDQSTTQPKAFSGSAIKSSIDDAITKSPIYWSAENATAGKYSAYSPSVGSDGVYRILNPDTRTDQTTGTPTVGDPNVDPVASTNDWISPSDSAPSASVVGTFSTIASLNTAIADLGFNTSADFTLTQGDYTAESANITAIRKNADNRTALTINLFGCEFSATTDLFIDSCKNVEIRGFWAPNNNVRAISMWDCALSYCKFSKIIFGEQAGDNFSSSYWNKFSHCFLQSIIFHEALTNVVNQNVFDTCVMRGKADQGYTSAVDYAIEFNTGFNVQNVIFKGCDISYHTVDIYNLGTNNAGEISVTFDEGTYFDTLSPKAPPADRSIKITAHGRGQAANTPSVVSFAQATTYTSEIYSANSLVHLEPTSNRNLVANGDFTDPSTPVKSAGGLDDQPFLRNGTNLGLVFTEVAESWNRAWHVPQPDPQAVYLETIALPFSGRVCWQIMLRTAPGATDTNQDINFGANVQGSGIYKVSTITPEWCMYTVSITEQVPAGTKVQLSMNRAAGLDIEIGFIGCFYGTHAPYMPA